MSKVPGLSGSDPSKASRVTPSILGHNDAGSPDTAIAFLGDTPGPLGRNDHADPDSRRRRALPIPNPFKSIPNPFKSVPNPFDPPKAQEPTPTAPKVYDRPRRTRVTIAVTGHASPRWRGARSDADADKRNLDLSRQREEAVRKHVKDLLKNDFLRGEELFFESVRSSHADDPISDPAVVQVDSNAVGSQQTLQEAGKAGRKANERSMLRVDLTVTLASVIDVVQVSKVSKTRSVSGATREWAIEMGMEMAAGGVFGGGAFNFVLRNRRTGQAVDGAGAFFTAGGNFSVPLPSIDMGGKVEFMTHQAVNFSTFDGARFDIFSVGFGLLIFGWELAMLEISLPGGVARINVGGWSMGGAGIDIGSAKSGELKLHKTPDKFWERYEDEEHKVTTSQATEELHHKVEFQTGKWDVTFEQDIQLRELLKRAVKNYQRPDIYREP